MEEEKTQLNEKRVSEGEEIGRRIGAALEIAGALCKKGDYDRARLTLMRFKQDLDRFLFHYPRGVEVIIRKSTE